MPKRDIIVVGSSTGGVEALSSLVAQLPAGLPASLFVVLHVSADHRSFLPEILSRAGALPALHPRDGEAFRPGHVYVAPSDHHLLLEPGRVRVIKGPRENGHRPAVDPLFRSAARAYGPRVAGVVLTGALDCGSAGLVTIKDRGGLAIVQEPEEALCPEMPRAALALVRMDHRVRLAELGPLLVHLASVGDAGAAPPVGPLPEALEYELKVMEVPREHFGEEPRYGQPSAYSCPDCGGVLYEMDERGHLRFRCHVGHAYTALALGHHQESALDGALWAALRSLEETAMLGRRMARRARESNLSRSAARYEERARAAEQHAALVRQVILDARPTPPSPSDEEPGAGT